MTPGPRMCINHIHHVLNQNIECVCRVYGISFDVCCLISEAGFPLTYVSSYGNSKEVLKILTLHVLNILLPTCIPSGYSIGGIALIPTYSTKEDGEASDWCKLWATRAQSYMTGAKLDWT